MEGGVEVEVGVGTGSGTTGRADVALLATGFLVAGAISIGLSRLGDGIAGVWFANAFAFAVLALSKRINDRLHVTPQAEFSRWPNTFSHIFAGGYAAGYYSYKWAEVLSADVYAAFEEAAKVSGTVLDTTTGARYRDEILAVGGSREAMESFIAFRGRAPQVDALLRHSGMSAN